MRKGSRSCIEKKDGIIERIQILAGQVIKDNNGKDIKITCAKTQQKNIPVKDLWSGEIVGYMKKASDIEVCEKIITLAKEVIKENGHDIRLYARDSKGRVLK